MPSNPDAKVIFCGPSPRGWHRLQQATECLQKYAWSYEAPKEERDAVLTKSPALLKGSLVHVALAQHYIRMKATQNGEDPDAWCEPQEAVELIAGVEGGTQFINVVNQTYEAYARHFDRDEDEWKILGVEELGHTKIKGKYLLTGRRDLIIEDRGGKVYAVDHKCQPADARVLTPEGPTTVEELLHHPTWIACAWDEATLQTRWARANSPVDAGEQDTFRIHLADGTAETYGHRHPILTDQGWREAKDISKGVWVAVSPPPDLPEADIPDAALRVLGLAMSDGGRIQSEADGYTITAFDSRVRAFLSKALDDLGDSWALANHGGLPHGIRLHVGGRARKYLEGFHLSDSLSIEKVFPKALYALSRRQAGILLGSLWEGDGAAYLGTPAHSPKKRRPIRILFSSRSQSMALGVRHLLLQRGILSNITSSTVVGAPYHQTIVVGFEGKHSFLSQAISGEIECPIQVEGGRETRAGRALEPLEVLLAVLKEGSHQPMSVKFPSQDYHGRGRVKNPRLEEGVRWVKVTDNEFKGVQKCYDIEVPKYHTFLTADCVVTHNTSARVTPKHKQYYTISGQLLGYDFMARQQYGDRYAGFIINLIEMGGKHFERIQLPRSPNMEAEYEQSIVDIEESIERLKAEGRPYDRWPKAMSELTCFHRYGPCEYIDQCRFGAGAAKAGNWSWEDAK